MSEPVKIERKKDPEGLITGGTESQTPEPSGASRERGRVGEWVKPPLIGGGLGKLPQIFF